MSPFTNSGNLIPDWNLWAPLRTRRLRCSLPFILFRSVFWWNRENRRSTTILCTSGNFSRLFLMHCIFKWLRKWLHNARIKKDNYFQGWYHEYIILCSAEIPTSGFWMPRDLTDLHLITQTIVIFKPFDSTQVAHLTSLMVDSSAHKPPIPPLSKAIFLDLLSFRNHSWLLK